MASRRVGIIAFLLCLCLLLPCYGQAVSTTDALEPIDTGKACDLTISYCCDDLAIADLPVRLYKIADVSADFQYTLTAPFASSGLSVNGIQTAGEWAVVRSTLQAHILAEDVQEDVVAATDQTGQVKFEGLKPGLFLATTEPVEQDGKQIRFGAALVALPGLDADGFWQYQEVVTAKPEMIPPTEPDEEIFYQVLKLWKGDSGRTDRPASIEVEIFCNGTSYETVVLSEENNWSYSWTTNDANASWMVVESNVPAGYTKTVEERGTTFVLTNTRNPDTPDTPTPPQTGDTTHILLYVVLMYISGSMLILLGIMRKRKRA